MSFDVRRLIRIMSQTLLLSLFLVLCVASQTHGLKHCFTLTSKALKHDQFMKTMNDSDTCPFDEKDKNLFATVELESDCAKKSSIMTITAKVRLDPVKKAQNTYEFNLTIEFQEFFSSNFRTVAGGRLVAKKINKLSVLAASDDDESEYLRNFNIVDFQETQNTLTIKASAPCQMDARLGTKLDLRKTPVKVQIIFDIMEVPGSGELPDTKMPNIGNDKTVYVLFPQQEIMWETEEEGICESFIDSSSHAVTPAIISILCFVAVALMSSAF